MRRLARHLTSRAALAVLVASFAAGAGLGRAPPPPLTAAATERWLGDALGGTVPEGGVAWGPSGGVLADATLGRPALVRLARGGGPADVLRVVARVGPDGHLLALVASDAIAETPYGDEVGLRASGPYVAWAAHAPDGVHGLSAVIWRTGGGRARGVLERVDVVFDTAAAGVELRLDDRWLRWVGPGAVRGELDLRAVFNGGGAPERVGDAWVVRRAVPPPPLAVDRRSERPAGLERPSAGASRFDESEGARASAPLAVTWEGPDSPAEGAPPPAIVRGVAAHEGRSVELHVIDLRRARLAPRPGRAAPVSDAGLAGTGRRVGADEGAVLARFGAPTSGESAGVRVGGRWLRTLSADGPVVAELEGGALAVGAWPEAGVGEVPEWLWQSAPQEEREAPWRTGLCTLDEVRLLHIAIERASPSDLARVADAAQCVDLVPLSAAPRARLTLGAGPPEPADDAELLIVERADAGAPPALGPWAVAELPQPPPAWSPSLFRGTARVGEVSVDLLALRRERVRGRLKPGRREPVRALLPHDSPAAERLVDDVVLWLGVGHALRSARAGLALGPLELIAPREGDGTLALAGAEPVVILAEAPERAAAADEQRLQLPLLLRRGEVTVAGWRPGPRVRRAALGVSDDWLFVAEAQHDSDAPLAQVLVDAGCSEAVALDRGSRHPASSGTGVPPADGDETYVALVPRPTRGLVRSLGGAPLRPAEP